MTPTQINNIITIANVVRFVRQTIDKVGLEYIAPLDPAEQSEKISKAVNQKVQSSMIKDPQ
jgi:hypothetical protein